jgi:electron transfer flavoprotein alpha subunit
MPSVVVAAALESGALPDSTFELATIGRSVSGADVTLVITGSDLADVASAAAPWFDRIIAVESPDLATPDGDLFAAVMAPLLLREQPQVVIMAHSNFAMDCAPRLSVLLDRPLVTDCLSLEVFDGSLTCTRTMYSGKLHARMYVALEPNGCVVTIRPGSVEVPSEVPGARGEIRTEVLADPPSTRRRYVRTVEPDAEDVDISQAEILVAVGRGIDDADNMDLIEELADVLGAEIGCSRPVVDNNWLPKSRQIGTSGVTVRPKIYLAVGISGSFQHLGGVKGGPFIAAINSDPRAPIFGEADVGIVGDLFDIVPVLTDKIRAARS